MVVVLTLEPPKANVWYLAYGSNLSSSKFVKDRGIVPIESAVVRVPGFTLDFTTAGIPYEEPSFASICRLPFGTREDKVLVGQPVDSRMGDEGRGTLLGTAYLVTPEQYKRIISSEGGGIAYQEVEVPKSCKNFGLSATQAPGASA
ncbi:gliotoxin biosynthesis protein GliK [Diaporthe helianthi]|uniref:Gliotoxin biosynthesis protein GliK n=1 Tax=Diaporthe helianthi TaxID=158607 RepID=A0A2P5IAY7_DIAHE|nr:gliotoxin biosynthesis protein GliK [Diaporthe helianthi]